ncbi:hypothetical protein PENPOL_c003G05434 [Penicillium polonicum]|uniref:Uncharacterized protein n=1 Tax=Penicillium polonicum TaxID=60169 RepID=A0A1V6NTM2_PENPO|nr:hypothetical protein PENPOL_c003G05434 [Penicillium polonicum]
MHIDMSDTESLQYTNDSDCEECTHTPNDATNTMFHLARPAPAKTSQKLHLRPRLIMQVQRVSCNAHAMPILEFWRPGVFNYRVVKHSIPEVNLRMNDIYVCQHTDYPLLDSDVADHEEDVNVQQAREVYIPR